MTARGPIAIFALLLAAGCERPCAVSAAVTPGCGVALDEGTLRIGDLQDDVEALLGPAASAADLGAAGTRFSYLGDRPIAGVYTDGAVSALSLSEGFAGQTRGGVGVGSGADAVRAAFGEPSIDPFQGDWWYPTPGVGFVWSDDAVSEIAIFAP